MCVQSARAEIACNMWVRNGHSLTYKSILYAQSSHCYSFIDLDVFLLQVRVYGAHVCQ